MSHTDQQAQTLAYFTKFAHDWQQKATGADNQYNVIHHRNATVMHAIASHGLIKRFLDVGCGTGQLVIAAAKEFGITATGVDFSAAMIEICHKNLEGSDSSATFLEASIFSIPSPTISYDAISAMGFIEYISLSEMDAFFAQSADWLSPGGILLVGSRNRLFNLSSLNDYTRLEMDAGTINALMDECIALSHDDTPFAKLAQSLSKGGDLLPQPTNHPNTGVDVSIRSQYTPGELIGLIDKYGLTAQNIYPIHYHAMPIQVMRRHSELHNEVAASQFRVGLTDCGMVPRSSSYVLALRKE